MIALFLEEWMEEIVFFILSFLFVLVLYEFFIVRRAKKRKTKNGKKESKVVEPMEVSYLVHRYHLDLEKVNYDRLLQVIAFTSSFDISFVVSVILLLKSFILEILVGFFCTIAIILVSYHIVYLVYKRGGMIKNES